MSFGQLSSRMGDEIGGKATCLHGCPRVKYNKLNGDAGVNLHPCFRLKHKKKVGNEMKNSDKVIAVTSVAAVLALVLDAIMFVQHGQSLAEAAVWGRLVVFIVLAVVVNGLALVKMRFCGYATVLVNLYFAIASLAALQTIANRTSLFGVFVQCLSVVGILVGCAGIYYGIRQRAEYTQARIKKLEERAKK